MIQVSELDPPEVPSLVIFNLALVPILLVEGEMLVGGDQNRTERDRPLSASGPDGCAGLVCRGRTLGKEAHRLRIEQACARIAAGDQDGQLGAEVRERVQPSFRSGAHMG